MEIPVIRIGNSRGIRLGKALLERYNIQDTVELELRKGHINIKPSFKPRKGWEKTFMEMNAKGDDILLSDNILHNDTLTEWK